MAAHLRTHLLTGLLVTVPVLVTYLLLRWLFLTLDNVLQPLFRPILGRTIPGLGLAAGTLLILVVGVVANNVLGRRFLAITERLMLRLPLARSVYSATKQVTDVIVGAKGQSFRRVVLVEWPRKGAYTIGFVTGDHAGADGRRVLKVFVISAPNPTTGFLMILPEAEAQPLELTVEQGMILMLSGGIAGSIEPVMRAIEKHRTVD